MVKDIFPGAGATFVSYPWIIGVAETVFLYADDGVHGPELWKSDGTAAGTVMVKDIRHGRASSNGGHGGLSFAVMGGVLYFTASRDHVAYDEWVDELWRSDGTADGTVMVEDSLPTTPISTRSRSSPLEIPCSCENQGRLVKSDGTSNPSGARCRSSGTRGNSPTSQGPCTSSPVTARTGPSCGRATGPRLGHPCEDLSGPDRTPSPKTSSMPVVDCSCQPATTPTASNSGMRRDRSRDDHGEGHQPRGRRPRSPRFSCTSPVDVC